MFKKIYKGFSTVAHALEVFDKYFSMALLVVLICIVFFQVASRVFTGISFVQIEELSIMLAAWVGFLHWPMRQGKGYMSELMCLLKNSRIRST